MNNKLLLCADPESPASIQLVQRSINSLTIQWSQNGGVDDYFVTVNGTDGYRLTKNNTTIVTATISNLTIPGAVYCLTITAVKGNLQSSSLEFCTVTGMLSSVNS